MKKIRLLFKSCKLEKICWPYHGLKSNLLYWVAVFSYVQCSVYFFPKNGSAENFSQNTYVKNIFWIDKEFKSPFLFAEVVKIFACYLKSEVQKYRGWIGPSVRLKTCGRTLRHTAVWIAATHYNMPSHLMGNFLTIIRTCYPYLPSRWVHLFVSDVTK